MIGRGRTRDDVVLRSVPRSAETCAAASAPATGRAFFVLAFAIFDVVTTEFVVVGLVPTLGRDLHLSVAVVGHLVTWFAVAAAVFGPPLTMLFERHPPRTVLVATSLTFGAASALFAVATSFEVMIAARVVQGALLPLFVSVASAEVVKLAGPGRESTGIAKLYAGVAAATVFGVPLGALLADAAGWRSTFVVLASLATVASVLVRWGFPQRSTEARSPSRRETTKLLTTPSFLLHLGLSALTFTGMFASYTYLAAFFEREADLSGGASAGALMGFGAAGLVGNSLAGRLGTSKSASAAKRGAGASTLSAASALVLAASMAIVAFAAKTPRLLVVGCAVWGVAHAASFVFNQVRVMNAGRIAPAFAASLNISVCNAGIALGAWLGGMAASRYGVGSTGTLGALVVLAAVPLGVALDRLDARSIAGVPTSEP